jgi:hypothetical protein
MHITQYLNKVREERPDDPIVNTLADTLEAWKTECENFFFNPTQSHARGVFDDIIDWEVEDGKG